LSYTLRAIDDAIVESKAITIESPGASENIVMFYAFTGITIISIEAVIMGSATPSVTINPTHTADVSAVGTAIFSSAQAITSTTTGQNFTSFSSAAITGGRFVMMTTTAQSGTVTQLHISIKYRKR